MSRSPFALSEPIVALATPPGRGALAIVRLSGAGAHDIARSALDNWPSVPRSIVVSHVRDGDGNSLDQCVVIRYDAPASFTGEDSVELITHGG
ncbi:MAG: tRNA uridine-5-carboxymethylaminomethyl(34) synthesis GTPase MnmE, partial [Gemmatimonas sp.]